MSFLWRYDNFTALHSYHFGLVLGGFVAPGNTNYSRDDARFSCSGLDVVDSGDLGLIFVPRAEQGGFRESPDAETRSGALSRRILAATIG